MLVLMSGLPLLSLLMSNSAHAGPWTRPAGDVYAKLGAGHFEGQAAFEDRQGPFSGDAAESYVEVGLGGGLELDGSMSVVSNRVGQSVSIGPQDAELLLEWAPVSSREAFALVAGARVATYVRGGDPELGPGGADLLAGAGWGRSLGAGWFASDVLLRHRLGSPSSGLRFRSELGVKGDTPFGSAIGVELQPAFGRAQLQDPDGPAPVPRVLGFSVKGFASLVSGLGFAADLAYLPSFVNDGPGFRIGAGLTWETPSR